MAQPQPESLFQSFGSALPAYDYHGNQHSAHEGGTTSKNTEPPKFAVQRPRNNNRWSDLGQVYLASLQTAGATPQAQGNAHALFGQFNNERIYNKEDAILHRNEADVVRTAALYLLHPVCQALNANPTIYRTFASQCEDAADGVRTDITFYKRTNGPDRPFAVVEFKRRTVIKRSEMDAAIRPYDPNAPTAAADLNAIVTAIRTAGGAQAHPTLFKSGSKHLIKQASAYAITNRTRYVALFDYDHLVCFYFPTLDHNQQAGLAVNNAGGAGDYVEIDIYPFTTESNQMRRALLGFLEEAYVNTPP